MHLKISLHCYCGDRGTLKSGAVNKLLHHSSGEHGEECTNSSSQQALLKKLPK